MNAFSIIQQQASTLGLVGGNQFRELNPGDRLVYSVKRSQQCLINSVVKSIFSVCTFGAWDEKPLRTWKVDNKTISLFANGLCRVVELSGNSNRSSCCNRLTRSKEYRLERVNSKSILTIESENTIKKQDGDLLRLYIEDLRSFVSKCEVVLEDDGSFVFTTPSKVWGFKDDKEVRLIKGNKDNLVCHVQLTPGYYQQSKPIRGFESIQKAISDLSKQEVVLVDKTAIFLQQYRQWAVVDVEKRKNSVFLLKSPHYLACKVITESNGKIKIHLIDKRQIGGIPEIEFEQQEVVVEDNGDTNLVKPCCKWDLGNNKEVTILKRTTTNVLVWQQLDKLTGIAEQVLFDLKFPESFDESTMTPFFNIFSIVRKSTPTSKVDENIKLSDSMWTVMLVAYDKDNIEILVEGLEKNVYFIHKAFLKRPQGGKKTGIQSTRFVDESQIKELLGIVRRSTIWIVHSTEVKRMLKNIDEQKENGPVPEFNSTAFLDPLKRKGDDNTVTWALQKLEIINIRPKDTQKLPNWGSTGRITGFSYPISSFFKYKPINMIDVALQQIENIPIENHETKGDAKEGKESKRA
ncbi:MAG: hypothetical protein H0W88_00945 [Parachlamydiaceae bacterium]|nr:hypothetical protein [Parachlamydiaceae bacterium]